MGARAIPMADTDAVTLLQIWIYSKQYAKSFQKLKQRKKEEAHVQLSLFPLFLSDISYVKYFGRTDCKFATGFSLF